MSNEDQDLTLESSDQIIVQGSEGIMMDGKAISLDSAGDVNLISSLSKQIRIDSKEILVKLGSPGSSKPQKKLCVCRTSGKLFTVDPDASCDTGSCP